MLNKNSKIILSNGIHMPIMAMGTNWMTYDELVPILKAGIAAGFRAFDTARDYGNEPVVGKAIKTALNETGLKRSDVFITTKIGNGQQKLGNISEQIDISLNNLQTDYVDCWLMHWPYPNYYVKTWQEMENVYLNSTKVKSIGVANYQIRHFKHLLEDNPNRIAPMVHQMEYHPLRTTCELTSYMSTHHIKLQAYAPLCRLISPLKEATILKKLSEKYHKSLGQIILRWHVQQQYIMPIFKSYKPSRFQENIDIFDFTLSPEEMRAISDLNMDYKYHLESASCPGY